MNLPALRAQLRDPSFRQGASDMLGYKNALPGYQRIDDPAVRRKFEALWGVPLPTDTALTVVEAGQAG